MKPYQVLLTPEAQSDLRGLVSATRTRLLDKLEWIGENAELIKRYKVMNGRDVTSIALAIIESSIGWNIPLRS